MQLMLGRRMVEWQGKEPAAVPAGREQARVARRREAAVREAAVARVELPVAAQPGTAAEPVLVLSAAGCCARFHACAPGKLATCTAPATLSCTTATPLCETPAFVVSYTSTCFEGCVQPSECAP